MINEIEQLAHSSAMAISASFHRQIASSCCQRKRRLFGDLLSLPDFGSMAQIAETGHQGQVGSPASVAHQSPNLIGWRSAGS
jgi:hypothetical protein